VFVAPLGGGVEARPQHRRHERGHADALALEHASEIFGIKDVQHHQASAARQHGERGRDDRGVEHRQHDQPALARPHGQRQAHLPYVRDHRPMAQDRTLRDSRGAARIHLIDVILGVLLEFGRRRRPF
jgi:hypothetical protein